MLNTKSTKELKPGEMPRNDFVPKFASPIIDCCRLSDVSFMFLPLCVTKDSHAFQNIFLLMQHFKSLSF